MPRANPTYYLARLRKWVTARGGRLLSRAYVNDSTKLRFQCAEGHEWSAMPGAILQGKWCSVCGRTRAAIRRKAPAIAKLHRIVARRGGTVLSPEYIDSKTKQRYRCAEGHEWAAVPGGILQGGWCPVCAIVARSRREAVKINPIVFDRLRRMVERHGGTMLSTAFVHHDVPLQVRCARGHTWMAMPGSLDKGTWCATCKEEAWLAAVRTAAEREGGECLSVRCRSGRELLTWRCALGHRWQARAQQVKRGHWCPMCRSPSPGNLARMRRIARERGGECLSSAYLNSETHLRWRCRNGHVWDADPARIIRGHWCRVCERGWGRSRARLSLEIMREMAAERGGACLSRSYSGIYGVMRWRCARGHTWATAANNVRRGGWCPGCAHSARGTLDGMRALAVERGGRCLTKSWNDHREPLRFECGGGHRFQAHANVVKSGVWCPKCRG